MKKTLGVLVALALLACACAMAEAVVPQFAGLDTADGTYNVCFRRENLKDGALNDVEIYTVDIYDIVDISKLAGGDTFTAEGREVTVESVETNGSPSLMTATIRCSRWRAVRACCHRQWC